MAKSKVYKCHASYLTHVFDPYEEIVKRARTALKGVRYDTLVGTGMSGALIVPVLAHALGKEWGVVRKRRDDSHSGHSYEGALARRWVFVDDLIDSGDTYSYVREAVENYCLRGEWRTTHVGAYLYNNYGDPEFLPADA